MFAAVRNDRTAVQRMHSLLSLTDSAPREGRPRPSRCIDPGQREFSAGRCTRSGGRPGGVATVVRLQTRPTVRASRTGSRRESKRLRMPGSGQRGGVLGFQFTPCAIEANPPERSRPLKPATPRQPAGRCHSNASRPASDRSRHCHLDSTTCRAGLPVQRDRRSASRSIGRGIISRMGLTVLCELADTVQQQGSRTDACPVVVVSPVGRGFSPGDSSTDPAS
jgi:hypothetical protein